MKAKLHSLNSATTTPSSANPFHPLSPTPPPATQQPLPIPLPPPSATNDPAVPTAVTHSLTTLTACPLATDLQAAARDLLNTTLNATRFLAGHPTPDPLALLFPLRCWGRTLPHAPELAAAGDPLTLLFVANHELVVLTLCARLGFGAETAELAQDLAGFEGPLSQPFRGDFRDAGRERVERARRAWLDAWALLARGAGFVDAREAPSPA